MSELLYHYQNPKFAGKPWPADLKKIRRRKCVKLNYSLDDAESEVRKLRKESPSASWSFKFCSVCLGWHVLRH